MSNYLEIKEFYGAYDYSIDDKNRLSIPSKHRDVMGRLKQKTFIISTLEDSCLTLYPYSIFKERIIKRIEELPQMDEDANEIRRKIGTQTMVAPLDNQGRIFIPTNFCQYAKIEKKVKIIGCTNKIELWNPELYVQVSQTSDKKSLKEELKKYKI